MRAILVAWILIAQASAALANCPAGSLPSIDDWGNQSCEWIDDGSMLATSGNLSRCPNGSFPWVDSWGHQICQAFTTRFYDKANTCPVVTDNWGNRVCQPN
jgi:hypothetical protein